MTSSRRLRLLVLLAAVVALACGAPPALATPPAPVITTADLCLAQAWAEIDFTGPPSTVARLYVDGVATSDFSATSPSGAGAFHHQLTDGLHTITATMLPAGGESPQSNAISASVHTAVPVITSPADGEVLGTTLPQAFISSGVPGCSAVVQVDGGAPITAPVDGAGDAVVTLPALALGSHRIQARNVDDEGVDSSGATNTFTVLPAPEISSPLNGTHINPLGAPVAVAFTGAVPGATVSLSIDGAAADSTAVADGDGDGTVFTSTVPGEGTYDYQLSGDDGGGHHSPLGDAVTVTIDTTVPPAPAITSPADGAYAGTARPAFGVTAEPDSWITLWVDGAIAGSARAAGDGTASVHPSAALGEGEHQAHVTATDAAGNVSASSGTVAIWVDTVAPAPPVIQAPGGGATITQARVRYVAEPFADVDFVIDGHDAGIRHADADGLATLDLTGAQPPLGDGLHSVSADAIDRAGNAGAFSAPSAFTLDTTAPAAPLLTNPLPGSWTGSDAITLVFHSEPGATVALSLDGGADLTQVADLLGDVYYDTQDLADGHHVASVIATDAVGNIGTRATYDFATDITAPVPPVIVSPADGSQTSNRPVIAVATAEPDQSVTVFVDHAALGTTTTGDDGAGTVEPAPGVVLGDGPHTLVAVAYDEIGHASDDSAAVGFTVVPAPVVTAPATADPPDAPVVHAPIAPAAALRLANVVLHGATLATCARHARRCTEKTVRLGFSVDRAATVHLTLKRSLHGRWTTAATATVRAPRAGAGSYVLHRRVGAHTLAPGRYHLIVQATSATGAGLSSSPVTLSLSVR